MSNEITVSRVIDAPRERVFDAWTDPESLNRWWGPQGFTNTTESIALRPGGVWQFVMHSPDGTDYPNRITFQEIVRPERITYLHGEDEDKPRDFHTTVTFDDLGGQTRVTLSSVFATAELREAALGFGAIEGGYSTLNSLAEFVAAGKGRGAIAVTRLIDAPLHAVWHAMTEPEQIKRWWGPEEFTCPVCRVDFRTGGRYLFSMQDTAGNVSYSTGVFREIIPMQRIVMTDNWADAEGNVVPASTYGLGDEYSVETIITADFAEADGKTALTLTNIDVPFSLSAIPEAHEGWNDMLDKLSGAVSSLPATAPLIISREFDAPVAAVWRAWTDPEQVMRWWGPEYFTSPLARLDFRVGGKYLIAMRDPEGNDAYSTGVYREIEPMKRIVYTDSFADAEGNVISPTVYGMGENFPAEMLVTLTFEDLGGRTRLTINQGELPLDLMYEFSKLGWATTLDKLAKTLE